MGPKLAVIGNGGHGLSVAEAAESMGFEVEECLPIRPNDNAFDSLIAEIQRLDLDHTALALGIGTNFVRQAAYTRLTEAFPKAQFPPIRHKTSWLSPTATIKPGAVVLAHGSVGPQALLGAGSVVNTGASLDHDGKLGDFASLGPGARTGGNVIVGARTMIGLQAGIIQGRNVGEDTVIGAQSLVLEDMPSSSVALGSPCKVVRSREPNERYY